MYKYIVPVLVILIAYILLQSNSDYFTSRQKVCNSVDGRCYLIVSNFDNSTYEQASDTLAKLNMFSIELMRSLREKYLWNRLGSPRRQKMVEYLLENYSPDSIIENNPDSDVNTSYVEDKGRIYAICLREKESGNNNIHDLNILKFVVMHEMSHMGSVTTGHEDPEFWINFKILLDESSKLGLYTPVNYEKYPVYYCSLKVDYNPLFDDQVPLL